MERGKYRTLEVELIDLGRRVRVRVLYSYDLFTPPDEVKEIRQGLVKIDQVLKGLNCKEERKTLKEVDYVCPGDYEGIRYKLKGVGIQFY